MNPPYFTFAAILLFIVALVFTFMPSHEPRKPTRVVSSSANIAAAGEVLNVDAFLWAIRQVESGDNPQAIGPRGERSAYQFMEATWRECSTVPFRAAGVSQERDEAAAVNYLLVIEATLIRRNLVITVRNLACAWHYGQHFDPAKVSGAYADRVLNLYGDKLRQTTPPMTRATLFPSIGPSEARRYIADARAQPNDVSAKIRAKLKP